MAFPNQHRLFALNFRSEQFSDHSLDLNYFPDNTIRSMTLSGTPNSEGFTSLAGAATAIPGKILSMDQDIATRAKALRDQDATRRTDRTTRLTDVLTFQAKQDALRKICQDWKAWEDAEAKKDPPSKPDVYGPEHVRLEGLAQTALKDLILAGVKIDQPVYDGNPFKLAVESIYKLFGGGSP